MKKLLITFGVAVSAFSFAVEGSSVDQKTVVNVRLPIDTLPFQSHIKAIDRALGEVTIDNGSHWTVEENAILTWEVGDDILVQPNDSFSSNQTFFKLINQTKNPFSPVIAASNGYVASDAREVYRIGIHIFDDPYQPQMFYLYNVNTRSDYYLTVPSLSTQVVENWAIGSDVIVQTIEDVREEDGVFLSVESLLVINPSNWSQVVAYPTPIYITYED